MERIELETNERNQFVDLDSRLQQLVHDSGVEKGTCFVFCPHTTGAITINEGSDPDVQEDLLKALKKLVPEIDFNHIEGNSDAHLKASLVGSSEEIPVINRKLKLGRWQKVYFCEFDGPRKREVLAFSPWARDFK